MEELRPQRVKRGAITCTLSDRNLVFLGSPLLKLHCIMLTCNNEHSLYNDNRPILVSSTLHIVLVPHMQTEVHSTKIQRNYVH
jgi:hypothetical protein